METLTELKVKPEKVPPVPSEHIVTTRLIGLEAAQEIMPFLLEGYEAIQSKYKNLEVDRAGFVKTVFGVLNSYPKNGILYASDERNGNLLGYTIGFDNTPHFSEQKIMLVWALYCKGFNPKVSLALLRDGTEWAKEQGYTKFVAYSSRFSGAGFNFFENKMGLRRAKILYTKDI